MHYHAGELAHAQIRGVRALERVIVATERSHVGDAAAFGRSSLADGVVVFVQVMTAQTVAELGMIDAVRAPRQQRDAIHRGLRGGCADVAQHGSVCRAETLHSVGGRGAGYLLGNGCRVDAARHGMAVAGGLRLGAAPAVVVDADEHEHRIGRLVVGPQQGGSAFGAAGGGEARAFDHAA